MSLLNQIKQDQISARKEQMKEKSSENATRASLLTTLYSEAAMVGKNAGRETTDAEVVSTVKKFLKGIEETKDAGGDTDELQLQQNILEQYLPQQLSVDQLTTIINTIVDGLEDKSMKSMGTVMKALKTGYDGQFDGKVASTLVRDILKGK